MTGKAVCAGAIVLKAENGRLLIALAHEPEKGAGVYVIPKGHIEANEPQIEAALREVREETGLADVQLVTYLGAIERKSVEDDGTLVDKTIHLYLGFAMGPNESERAKWVELDEAVRVIPYAEDREFLRERLAVMVG